MHRTVFLVVDLLMILGGLKGITNFIFEEAFFVLDVSGDGFNISYCISVQVLAMCAPPPGAAFGFYTTPSVFGYTSQICITNVNI